MKISLSLPVAAEALIPHRLPLRVIDRLVEFNGSRGVVESCILPHSIFANSIGVIEQAVMIELIAQSFAAVKGYSDLLEGKSPGKGFLVEVKRFSFRGTAFEGDRLSIIIDKVGETAEFAVAEGEVMGGGEVVASGRVMVWIPQDI